MKVSRTIGVIFLALAILPLTISCGGGDGGSSTIVPEPTQESPEAVVITIGNLTDLTGPASVAMTTINMGLEDLVRYYNEQKLIPGVRLEVLHYDGQYDPSKDIPGYERLKEKGADIIFTPVASAVIALKPRLEADRMVLFTVAPSKGAVEPGGYVFAVGSPFSEDLGYTLLKWVAENAPDFPKDRPARIGGAFWKDAYGHTLLTGAEAYVKDHPDQYVWDGSHLTGITFTWSTEVEALKDCDYVIPPVPMNTFVKEFRDAGGKARFIGTHAHDAFMGLIDDGNLWDEINGTLFLRASELWNDEGTTVKLMKQLLHQNHPDDAEAIIREGCGYLTGYNFYVMLELMRKAVEVGGPQSFGSEAIFEAAESFSLTIDGVERETFTETRRISINYLLMYELRAAEEDEFRVPPLWYPIVPAPDE